MTDVAELRRLAEEARKPGWSPNNMEAVDRFAAKAPSFIALIDEIEGLRGEADLRRSLTAAYDKQLARAEAAEARGVELRRALEPFAQFDDEPTWPDNREISIIGRIDADSDLVLIPPDDLTIGDLRRARAALSPPSNGEGK